MKLIFSNKVSQIPIGECVMKSLKIKNSSFLQLSTFILLHSLVSFLQQWLILTMILFFQV